MVRPELRIESDNSHLLRPSGEIDMLSAGGFAPALAEAAQDAPLVLIDMAGSRSWGSTGIRELVAALRAQSEGCFVLHGVQPHVARVLDILGLSGVPRLHVIACDNRLKTASR